MANPESLGRCTVTVVYGDTLTKGRPGYIHPRTVPERSTVTLVYWDTLTKGYHGYVHPSQDSPGKVHSYSSVLGYSDKGVPWVRPYRDCPRRFTVTQVYRDTLRKE